MKFEINDEFEVIEKGTHKGITFGQHVVKAGFKFKLKDWPYSESMLEAAILDERVKKIGGKKDKSEEKIADKQALLDEISGEYVNLDPESSEAKKLLKKINKLEAELE